MLTTTNGMAQEHCVHMMKNNLILEDKGKAEDFEKREKNEQETEMGGKKEETKKTGPHASEIQVKLASDGK